MDVFDTRMGLVVELAVGAPKATEEIQSWSRSISALTGFVFVNGLDRFHFLFQERRRLRVQTFRDRGLTNIDTLDKLSGKTHTPFNGFGLLLKHNIGDTIYHAGNCSQCELMSIKKIAGIFFPSRSNRTSRLVVTGEVIDGG